MEQDMKYSSSGRMRISAGYKPGNMAAFMYGSTKRKRKKRVKGKQNNRKESVSGRGKGIPGFLRK